MVLCGSTNQCDSANVNFLNSFINCDIDLCNSVLEWVEIADYVVDLVDVLFREILLV